MRVIISIAVCLLQIWMAQAQTTGPAKGALVIVGGNDKAQLCFKEFLKLAGGTAAKIVIETPLINKSKKEPVLLAQEVGAREALALSHTCYNGERPPCGHCHACLLRQKGFEEAGVEDPLLSEN